MTTISPWTPESAAYAADLYHKDHHPRDIAVAMARSERSVIAKLTQLGLYRAAPKATREPTKAELVGELCEIMGLNPNLVYTLCETSKPCLIELTRAARHLNQ